MRSSPALLDPFKVVALKLDRESESVERAAAREFEEWPRLHVEWTEFEEWPRHVEWTEEHERLFKEMEEAERRLELENDADEE
jgi:hypothetical protein